MASNHDLQKTASNMEEEFLKRFSLRKFTVPQEKPKDFPNTFKDQKKDALEEGSSSQKSYRIEYKKLSSVIKTVGPWWLPSRGCQENMSSEILVTLVEDCGKPVYGSQFPIPSEEQTSLSSYSKDHQNDMLSAKNYMETNYINGDFHPNGLPFSELGDTGSIGKRVSRLLSFFNNFEYVRLTSGCEKCRQQEMERNKSSECKGPGTSEFPDIVSNLNLCVCGLQVIDEEMVDLCQCLQKLMNCGQCNCDCAIKKLQELRIPLREIIKNVKCQAELSKKEEECSHVENHDLLPLDEPTSSKKKTERPRSKLKDKLRCIPKKVASDEYVRINNPSKRSKTKSHKSDTHCEDADASTSKQKTTSKRAVKRSKGSKFEKRGRAKDKSDETAGNRMMCKFKKKQQYPEVNRIANEEKPHCHDDYDASGNRFKTDSEADVTNHKIMKSAICQTHFDEGDDSSENDESFANTENCRHSDSEEEQYFVTNKQVQTDFQSQPIFVPCFIYDQEPTTKDRSEENEIEICQDRGNRKLITECPRADRNKRVSFVSNQERSTKNETKTNYPQTIKPCCCDQCRCRRNFRGGAEVVDTDQDELIEKRRRRSSVLGKCKCNCECSSYRNATNLDQEIDESDVYPQFSGRPNKGNLMGSYRTSTLRRKIIERNADSTFPMRKSVTTKKETRKKYFYPTGRKGISRNDKEDEEQTGSDLEDVKVPFSKRRSKKLSKYYKIKQTGGTRTSIIDYNQQRRSVSCQRSSKSMNEDGFDNPDKRRSNRKEIVEDKQYLRNDIEKENFEDAISTCSTFGTMDGYESSPIVSKKTSRVQIMEDRSLFDGRNDTNGRRSIRKSLRETENVIEYENEFAPAITESSSRIEISEESTSLIPNSDSDEIVKPKRSPSKTNNNFGERRSTRKSFEPREDLTEYDYDDDPTMKTRSSRTEIVKERKSTSNRRKDDRMNTDRRCSHRSQASRAEIIEDRKSFIQKSDTEGYDSVNKRTSRVEIVELNRPPSKIKPNFWERRPMQNSLRPREDMTDYNRNPDPTITKRSSRTEIVEKRKSLLPDSDWDEYDSVNKRTSRVEVMDLNLPPSKSKTKFVERPPMRKSSRPGENMTEYNRAFDPTTQKSSKRTEISEESTSLIPNSDSDEIVKLKRSLSPTNNNFSERRSIRKSLGPREDTKESTYDFDTKIKRKSNRSEIKEERKSLIPDSDSDEYDSVNKRTSRFETVELKQSPSKININLSERRSIRKSLGPREDVTEYDYDVDPTIKTRSSRTEIVEERKSTSNRSTDDRMNTDRRYSARDTLVPNLDPEEYDSFQKRSSRVEIVNVDRSPPKRKIALGGCCPIPKAHSSQSSRSEIIEERKSVMQKSDTEEYDSVNKRTSRVEIVEFNGPPSKTKYKFWERRPLRKSSRPGEDMTEYNRNLDPTITKRSSRTEIKEERKSLIPDSDSDEYDSVSKRTSRVEIVELKQSPSKTNNSFSERRSIRKSLGPREDTKESTYDFDTKIKRRSNRSEIKEERKSLIPDSDSDEYDSVHKKTSRVEIVDLKQSPSKTNNNFSERRSIQKSLRPREDVTEYDTDRCYSARDTWRPNSDLEEYDSIKKRSSKTEVLENTRSSPNGTYSMTQTTQERRTTKKYLRSDDDDQPQTSDKSSATEFAKEQVQDNGNCSGTTQQVNRNNCIIALNLKPNSQDTQSTAICNDEDEYTDTDKDECKQKCPWSITAVQTRGEIEAQLELKTQGVQCRISDNESPQSADDSTEMFCYNCYGKNVPVVRKDLAQEIRQITGNREPYCIFLKFTIVKNLYHIQISTENEFLGCLYATPSATLEARKCKAFDGYTTLSVTESSNTMSQIEELVDHAFVVVKKEDR